LRKRLRGDRADSQGDGGELNEGQGGVLWRATRRSDGEKALTIFIGGQKAAVQTVDIGHELLRQKNARHTK